MKPTMKFCTGSAYLKESNKDSDPTICPMRSHCRRYLEHSKLTNNAESKKAYPYINAANCMERDYENLAPHNKEQKHTPNL